MQASLALAALIKASQICVKGRPLNTESRESWDAPLRSPDIQFIQKPHDSSGINPINLADSMQKKQPGNNQAVSIHGRQIKDQAGILPSLHASRP
jgi:hypothetical protein